MLNFKIFVLALLVCVALQTVTNKAVVPNTKAAASTTKKTVKWVACPTDGRMMKCDSTGTGACGTDKNKKVVKGYVNWCQACSLGKLAGAYNVKCNKLAVKVSATKDKLTLANPKIDKAPLSSTLNCASPRPKACTKDFKPSCGIFDSTYKCSGAKCGKQYSNGCVACVDPLVKSYYIGQCAADVVLVPEASSSSASTPSSSNSGKTPTPGTPPSSGPKTATLCPEKRSEMCTQEYLLPTHIRYSDTCGLFGPKVQCIKAPCGQQFSNGCMACANAQVASYYPGPC